MRYCSNCGKELPSGAKFCTHCGHPVPQQQETGMAPPQPESPEVIREFSVEEVSDTAYKLLEPGTDFRGYRILRMLNKDPEGIKYIGVKDGKQYVLKLFFKYKFSNLDTLIGLQARLKRLNQLDTSYAARVVEVNQNHDPAYMVAEFVSGKSLATIKASEPARLTEDFVRSIASQLVQTAAAVRQQGLSLYNLTLSGIMVSESDKITVLSSGITYEEIDERDEIFNLGILLAQLLSRNVLYKSIYNHERLSEQKFSYIPGTTLHLNKLLADCLHRNIIQRHSSLASLQKALSALPPVAGAETYTRQGPEITMETLPNALPPQPKPTLDWRFYLLIGVVAALIVFFLTFALPRIIKSGGSGAQPIMVQNGISDSSAVPADLRNSRQQRAPGDGFARQPQSRSDPRKQGLPAEQSASSAPKTTVRVASPIPSNFARVPDGSFGFNRLKENPKANVFQDGFYISRTELTQADWNKYMMPADVSSVGDRLPVDNVSWMNAIRYCNARSEKEGLEPCYQITGSSAASVRCNFNANGYRLPTEAEWEMAAKAGQLYDYSGSDELSEVGWYRDNSAGKIKAGATKKANSYGLYDMTGNVSEWCWDWYNSNYPNSLDSFINPAGPSSGSLKVVRGGSVRNGEGTNIGLLYRDKGDPGRGYIYVGFRLVRKR